MQMIESLKIVGQSIRINNRKSSDNSLIDKLFDRAKRAKLKNNNII